VSLLILRRKRLRDGAVNIVNDPKEFDISEAVFNADPLAGNSLVEGFFSRDQQGTFGGEKMVSPKLKFRHQAGSYQWLFYPRWPNLSS
jgi:hypothetical protein